MLPKIATLPPERASGWIIRSWTPQLYQNGNIASTNNVSRWWMHIGAPFITVQFRVTATAAGTAGQAIEIRNLPIAPLYAASAIVIGSALLTSGGNTTAYACTIQMSSTPAFRFRGYNVTGYMGVNPNFAIASDDVVQGTVIYEI